MTPAAAFRRDGRAWASAGLGVMALCVLFRPEIAAAVTVWNDSTAYGHCWLVLPIALWLLWDRRAAAASYPARPTPWAALAALPALLLWIASDLLGIMEGRQIAAVLLLLLLLLAVLGPGLWWALSAGFFYLLFLVPFGAFLTPALQHFTTGFIEAGLLAADIPFEANAFQITVPEGVFYVAEACAGLRFLIASIAFGVLYALTMFRSPWRRAVFIGVSCVVPVLANGVRGFGIVLLGHVLGSAEAGAADHLIYGWVFFSAVIVLLALAGLPFREPPVAIAPTQARSGSPPRVSSLAAAVCLVLLLAGAGKLLAARPDSSGGATPPALPATLAECATGALHAEGAMATVSYACADQVVQVTGTSLPRNARPDRVLDAARIPAVAGLGQDVDTELWVPPNAAGASPRPWMLARARDTGRESAYAVQADGVQGVGGLGDRLRLLRGMLGGASRLPQGWAVQVRPGGPEADRVLKAVLVQLGASADRR